MYENLAGKKLLVLDNAALSVCAVKRARELGVTASDWFLTAFMELLRRVGRSDDVQIRRSGRY